jgi:hypothetical protein
MRDATKPRQWDKENKRTIIIFLLGKSVGFLLRSLSPSSVLRERLTYEYWKVFIKVNGKCIYLQGICLAFISAIYPVVGIEHTPQVREYLADGSS